MTRRTVISGGAGFIGTNLADRLLRAGDDVVVVDDLSRPGVEQNLRFLEAEHGSGLRVEVAGISDAAALRRALVGADRVFHFAAQVAVTTSVADPVSDFETNLRGTVTLLEELRRCTVPPALLFTSTNKVYGDLCDVVIEQRSRRYEPADPTVRRHGVGEDRPLQFVSPYGCSKGGADQYVLDYAHSYGLPTVVFRMSCIYGPHQCGNEDQGWVAHFLLQALRDRAITLYGDGRQVRDILFVDDLLDAMLLAIDHDECLRGNAYNMGGGPGSTVSLLEILDLIGEIDGRHPQVEFGPWRVGDQRWYVSDTRRFTATTGWSPKIDVSDGVARLHRWFSTQAANRPVVEAR